MLVAPVVVAAAAAVLVEGDEDGFPPTAEERAARRPASQPTPRFIGGGIWKGRGRKKKETVRGGSLMLAHFAFQITNICISYRTGFDPILESCARPYVGRGRM